MGNVINEKIFNKYIESFEGKMKDSNEAPSEYTHVVYLYPGYGAQLYPFYVNSDDDYEGTVLALAVKQAVEKGLQSFYWTEEDLTDLTDEEKDENYIYFDLSEYDLPNVYIDAYNTKIFTKEEDPWKPEKAETPSEEAHPVEDSFKLSPSDIEIVDDARKALARENIMPSIENVLNELDTNFNGFMDDVKRKEVIEYLKNPKHYKQSLEDSCINDDTYFGRVPRNAEEISVGLYSTGDYQKQLEPSQKTIYLILPKKGAYIKLNQEQYYASPLSKSHIMFYSYPQDTLEDIEEIAKDIIAKCNAKAVTEDEYLKLKEEDEPKEVNEIFNKFEQRKSLGDSYKVEFYVEGNLLEGQTEEGFESFEEAEEYAEDQVAVISQNGMEKEIPLEDITYEIVYDSETEEDFEDSIEQKFIISWYEDGEYLYSQGLFDTIDEADEYAEDNFGNQVEASDDRLINQEELNYEVEPYDEEEAYEDLRIVK